MNTRLIRTCFFLLLVGLPVVVSAAVPQAKLKNIQGKVEIKAYNTQSWVPAEEGMAVKTMTTISTGFDSSVTLEMSGNTIFVKPLTRMTLDQLIEQEGTVKTSCYLRVGAVKASVKSAEGVKQDFQVQSPYSTASVRGTIFEYDGLKLNVLEGTVALIPGRPRRNIQIPVIEEVEEEEEEAEEEESSEDESQGIEESQEENQEEPGSDNADSDEAGSDEQGQSGDISSAVPDLSADFVGSPDIDASGLQEVFVTAGNNAQLVIQRGGGASTSFSGDESVKKKSTTVTVTDSNSQAAAAAAATSKPAARSKYGTVVITVTAPEK